MSDTDDFLGLTLASIDAEKCRRSFYYFIKTFWEAIDPAPFVDNWHIKYLADIFEHAAKQYFGKIQKGVHFAKRDIMINCPPSTSKSMIISVMFPVWVWTFAPTAKFITASYSSSVATELAVKSRNLILSDKFRLYFPTTSLQPDDSGKTFYKTTFQGYRAAIGSGQNILGIHADFIICDDIENLQTIYSDAQRESVHKWITGTLSTRKVNHQYSTMVFVQQRLHQLDLTNYLLGLRNKLFIHIVLSAVENDLIKPVELKQYYIDGLLDPVRLSRATLDQITIDLGSRDFDSQFQQLPADVKHSIIKKQWLKIQYSDESWPNINLYPRQYFIDTAYGGVNADYNAILECFVVGQNLVISKIIKNKEEFPELVKTIKDLIKPNAQTLVYIEAKASGKSVVQQLRSSSNLNIVELQTSDNKITRLNAIAPTVEAGRVILLNDYWNEDFLGEVCTNYPDHDDVRDVFTYAVNELLVKKSAYADICVSFI